MLDAQTGAAERLAELGQVGHPQVDADRVDASTISVEPGWAEAGVVSFWIFAALAVAGVTRRAARQVPAFVWLMPLALYLSVIFLAA